MMAVQEAVLQSSEDVDHIEAVSCTMLPSGHGLKAGRSISPGLLVQADGCHSF